LKKRREVKVRIGILGLNIQTKGDIECFGNQEYEG
jgi:hypothetical protein